QDDHLFPAGRQPAEHEQHGDQARQHGNRRRGGPGGRDHRGATHPAGRGQQRGHRTEQQHRTSDGNSGDQRGYPRSPPVHHHRPRHHRGGEHRGHHQRPPARHRRHS